DHASAVALVTGHEQPDKDESALDFTALARFPGTLVFYMGVSRLSQVVQALIDHGKDADTPAAAIARATTAAQQTLTAPLHTLPRAVEEAGIRPPALVFVGSVVTFRDDLAWFESRPLFGQRVLVTRPRHQAGSLARRLEELGAEAILLPAVEVREPADWAPVDRALADLSRFDWLVFTSANGVHFFVKRLRQ